MDGIGMYSFEQRMLEARLIDIEVLDVSERKDRRYYSAFLPEGTHIFIKHQLDSDENGLKKIEREKEIFNALGRKVYLIDSGDDKDYIASDFMSDYKSLRQLIEDGSDALPQMIKTAFLSFTDMIEKLNSQNLQLETAEWDRLFRMHYTKLMMSRGWWGGPNWRVTIREYFLGYSGYLLALPFKFRLLPMPEFYISHGDLHLANIMCKDTDAIVIDVENMRYGDVNMDAAYLYVALWFYCRKDKKVMNVLDEALSYFERSKYCNKKILMFEIRVFKLFVRMNPRFR
ncbi:MAG: phosphotransferase [Saccharofermentans sp.]|nr:phosphotransferase [Saccharofermentans sp.]